MPSYYNPYRPHVAIGVRPGDVEALPGGAGIGRAVDALVVGGVEDARLRVVRGEDGGDSAVAVWQLAGAELPVGSRCAAVDGGLGGARVVRGVGAGRGG